MKNWIWVLLGALLLGGCADQTVYEPVQDVYEVAAPAPGKLMLAMPQEASVHTLASEQGKLYSCNGYTLSVQTLPGGNLNGTLEYLTGYGPEQLTLLETVPGRYTCSWVSASEAGDQISRLVLIEEGVWHYAVTVMADADRAGALQQTWDTLLNSVRVDHTGL